MSQAELETLSVEDLESILTPTVPGSMYRVEKGLTYNGYMYLKHAAKLKIDKQQIDNGVLQRLFYKKSDLLRARQNIIRFLLLFLSISILSSAIIILRFTGDKSIMIAPFIVNIILLCIYVGLEIYRKNFEQIFRNSYQI